ncbi:SDR family NAD(P)-dependent oxidoreductase [Variovorax sp. HW608]|uniref:SDR family NAD(P)-dependent oxidoreductase n=1 Tax=Variovorax sp. HW608 TaxID=1034889 RepID=UPI000B5ADEE5|nr:SDR family NAD(P)-dependent oxidoreductase [Variovorax sp. HW608]
MRRRVEKVCLVTGGSNGIGQALCERLAGDGMRIVVFDRQEASTTLKLVERAGSNGAWIPCDITDPAQVEAGVLDAVKRFGRIDVLVHCAGIYPMQAFEDISFDDWRRVFSVNLDSLFHLLKAVLPGMKARGWGRVVGIASNTFHAGTPMLSHYVASKGGLIGLIRSLAAELGSHGITANAVAPTLVRTNTTEQTLPPAYFEFASQLQAIKRTSMPQDYTGTVSFLCSDDASFMTGQTLLVDGGAMRA